MKKRIWHFRPILVTLIVLCVIMSVISLIAGKINIFYFEIAATVLVGAYSIYRYKSMQSDVFRILKKTFKRMDVLSHESLLSFNIPLIIVREGGEIIWYNDIFSQVTLGGKDCCGDMFAKVFPGVDIEAACSQSGINVSYGEHCFTVYAMPVEDKNGKLMVMQWVENTELKALAQEYYESRQSVMLISIDNYDEITQNVKESEKAQVTGEIDNILEEYIATTSGISVRTARDKFIVILEERHLRELIEKRFDILDKVRQVSVGERQFATLSIGVGRGAADIHESEQMARQALDMALGRGGDQAALKTPGGYEFFGGVSKGIEKRTKVKTRIMAAAMSELIASSDNCIVMGHRFADLDCFGASVGLMRSIRLMGKPCVIAIDRDKSLVTNLYDMLHDAGFDDALVAPEQALTMVNKKTLLLVVDTHIASLLESQEIYDACRSVVVIDHHRKMVGHIENAVIFYHEPYASSASEMVAELVQYFNLNDKLGSLEAEALLAGIMLDTKNFILKTGVRTFEAAAYLRKLGADTVEVKKLFSSSMDAYQTKTNIVSSAKIYRKCAIAVSHETSVDMRIVVPQAADELLSISGVDASFVLYQSGDTVNISARSLGDMNVQVVMERMGGGGHLTMAGTYMQGETLENALALLTDMIDKYYDEAPSAQQ